MFDGVDECLWREVVIVAHHEGHHIIGVLEHPLVSLGEVSCQGAGVEDVATSVAEADLAALVVCLELDCVLLVGYFRGN